MPTFKTIPDAAKHFDKKSPRTVETWIEKQYVTPYSDGSRIFVDIDEIEREMQTNPHMRDGRKRFNGAKIIPLPADAKIVRAIPRAEVVTSNTVAIS